MRLRRHLKDSDAGDYEPKITTTKTDEIIAILKRDCKPFLSSRRSKRDLLWRGVKQKLNSDYVKITTRTNRKPKDTPKELHDLMNFEFKKAFGWKPRSEGVFTFTKASNAGGYGNQTVMMFPIGNFKYVWSNKIEDLWNEMNDNDVQATVERFIDGSMTYWNNWEAKKGYGTTWKQYKENNPYYAAKKDFYGRKIKDFKTKRDFTAFIKTHYLLQQKQVIKDAIKLYTDKGIWDNEESEIMVKCKSYYLVDSEFEMSLIDGGL
jgi:hypothetical protein